MGCCCLRIATGNCTYAGLGLLQVAGTHLRDRWLSVRHRVVQQIAQRHCRGHHTAQPVALNATNSLGSDSVAVNGSWQHEIAIENNSSSVVVLKLTRHAPLPELFPP